MLCTATFVPTMVYGSLLTLQTDLTAPVNSYQSINDEHNVFGLINDHFLPLPVNRVANNGFKPFEMLFKASRCDDVDLVKSFAGELNTKLGVMVMIQTCMHRCSDFPVVCFQNIGSSFVLSRSSPTYVAVIMSPASWRWCRRVTVWSITMTTRMDFLSVGY